MFALRLIQETRESEERPFEQEVETYELGVSYALLKKGVTKEFDKVINQPKYADMDTTRVRSVVCGDNGLEFFVEDGTPLAKNTYYIMTDGGATFEKL